MASFCVVFFASGILCFFLLLGCSLGGFVLADAAWARSELAVFCFLVLVVCLASLRPLKKSAVQKKKTPSSIITLTKKNHVFLSFRGEDTRVGFISHLYNALSQKQIATFIDYKLARGDEISPALLKSIQESKIAVIIFSKDYASSKWCLRELAEIMKCKKLNELDVLPVFYYVDPSDVRKQSGPFKDSFHKHKNESQEEVQEWIEAFTEASNLAGWEYAGKRPEAELVRDIVKDVQRKLMSEIEYISSSSDFEGLIGIHERIEQVMSLLCLNTMDVRIIGIWGMGGIGKTTLAEAVFKLISGQFEGVCFMRNVRERIEKHGALDSLEHEVLSKVLDEENLKSATPTILHPFIKERLNRKKVLIVFDDVNNFLQLETLVEVLNRCGLGSRMIMTSRDKQVLDNFVDDHDLVYEVEGLDHDEAHELFHKYAFKKKDPTEDLIVLTEEIVYYAKGNPLALKVLGSSLQGKSKQEWESALDNLQGIGESQIFNVLKISYDGLNDEEKNLFLDIACFFNDNFRYCFEQNIVELLDCKYSLSVLIDKSLVTSGIEMHDLLQEMGREIVRRESPKNPGKRSRLWKHDDVIRTLKNNNGAEEVEGIYLNIHHHKGHLNLSCRVFDKMTNLRLLLFTYGDLECINLYLGRSLRESNKVHLSDGCLNSLPDELIILEWPTYPLRALPSNFSPEKLVRLDLTYSNIEQLWEGTKHALKLKWLILRHCTYLIRIPNLSHFLSLEEVDLSGCKSLVKFPSPVQQHNNLRYLHMAGCSNVEFPSSVQQLTKLWYLDLSGCSNVTKFPLTSASIERLNLRETAIEEVPSSIQSLTNLTELGLSGCRRLKHISASIFKLKSVHSLELYNCSELETFPEISETMEILNSLELSGTAITDLCSSIEHLNGFQRLTLRDCKNLEMLPSSICDLTSLEELDLSNCTKLDKLPEKLGNLKSLKKLTVWRSAVGQLPSSIRYLENLECLDCSECRGLTILPPLSGLRSLSRLLLKKCNLIEIPEDIGCLSSLQWLDLCGNMFESLPKSIKHLSKLKTLLLRDCNMLRSLTELPVALQILDATNCKKLCQALPDEFKSRRQPARFFFTNCFKLDQKAVSNVFEESLKGSEEQPTHFSICLPGTEIPEWFTYQSSGSSVNVQVLRQDLVNRKFMGFAICAVFGHEKYHREPVFLTVEVNCHFETAKPVNCHFETAKINVLIINLADSEWIINSNHIILGYSPFSKFLSSSQNLKMLIANDSDYVDISFKFKSWCEVKYCAVHPTYAEPIEIIGATIEDIGVTSLKRSGRSNDNEEEVEPHPKRICTQPN